MTDDPLARLRGELVRAADRRAAERTATAAPCRRRAPYRRGGWIALVAALIAAPAGATATGIIRFGGESPESQGRKIALQASRDMADRAPCLPIRSTQTPVLSDGEPLPAITAALPALKSAPAGADPAGVLRALGRGRPGGAVLRRTVRSLAMTNGITLTVYVQEGGGGGAVRDPAACAQVRRDRAEILLRDRSDPTRRWALRRLAEYPDTAPGLQTLWVYARRPHSASGSGSPVRPGVRLRAGMLSSGSAGQGRRSYVGIAGPRAASVVLRAERAGALAGARTRFPVRQRLYAVVLRTGTGPVSLREVSADGTVLRVIRLRR